MMKTTNYHDTFIEVAEDCPVKIAEIPPLRGKDKSVARIQYDLLHDAPYQYTSDDVLFQIYTIRNNVVGENMTTEGENFFSKGQPCFRSSPLTKRYGWGVHSDSRGRIAIYPIQSVEYLKFVGDKNLTHLRAMRSKRG